MINPDGLFFGDTLIYGCLIFIVYLHCYHFEGLGTKFLLTTFYNFFDTSCFLKSEKNSKIRILEHSCVRERDQTHHSGLPCACIHF